MKTLIGNIVSDHTAQLDLVWRVVRRDMTDDEIMESMRADVHATPFRIPPPPQNMVPQLAVDALRSGVRFGWQYAQLGTKELTDICEGEIVRQGFAGNVDTATVMHVARGLMAEHFGLLPDTRLPEEALRDILNRPRNLFAVPGMEKLLGEKFQIVYPEVSSVLERHFPGPRSWLHVRHIGGVMHDEGKVRDGRGMYPSVRNLLTEWQRIMLWGNIDTACVLAGLAELGLWAPLVWTEEEKAHLDDERMQELEGVARKKFDP